MRRVFVVIATTLALAGPAMLPTSTRAQRGSASSSPCPHEHTFTEPSQSIWQAVTVPPAYAGSIFRPKRTHKFPGKRPGIVVMHGGGGTQCSLEWAARFLAARGYVTLVITDPTPGPEEGAVPNHILATKRAVRFLRSSSNPFKAYTDVHTIGLAGHSLGSTAIAAVQADTKSVKAIVALDNLKHYLHGDPATALHCKGAPTGKVTPRVPALGMAMDRPCAAKPAKTDKQNGYRAWRAAKVPAMELVMRGFVHTDFAGNFADTPANQAHTVKLQRVSYYMLAWFDRWLLKDPSQDAKLLSDHPDGIPIGTMLSARQTLLGQPSKAFHSAAYLPGRIDCANLVPCLMGMP